jgi:outer membrane receptor protein involved in Fe transport
LSSVDELKLRGAWGQTGNQPVFGNKYSPDTTGTIGGRFGKYAGQRAGDPGIAPERQTEVELGFDALLFRGRLNASVTWFNKTINDLLLFQTLHPSSGQADRVFNGGSLRNRGVEVGLGWSAIQQAGLNLIFRGTFFSYRPVITELPVPAFEVGGFGTALGVFRIEEGKSATQIIGNEGVVGDATPDFQMGLSADLDWKQWSLGVLFDWKKGGDVINLTELLYDAGANSADWNTAGTARWGDFTSGLTQPYVQDASYIKMRELTLSYRLPGGFTRGVFGSTVQSARVSLSGRNLLRFTDFRGIDPEVSNFGNAAIARNIDVAPYPPSRSVWLSIDLDF